MTEKNKQTVGLEGKCIEHIYQQHPTQGSGDLMSRLTREGELCQCTDKKRLSITLLIAFLSSIGLLAILVLFAVLLRMERSVAPTLIAHPNALWVGGEDGGVFIEVSKAEAPNYYVQVRHENGDMWSQGWVRYSTKDGFPLSAAGITGFDGEQLYLHTSTAMTSEKARDR
ncbi:MULTISPECIES: hypothetical protein [Pseudomonas]|jgi:hypothetical protein|uniref:hypothetical protein n=1 Tax=Pseudomonas TaxID=286 RepID=UPI0021150F90|nr:MULTISPECIES: hypothetical protein [Pseudomonas]